jgi:hypothetical protein
MHLGVDGAAPKTPGEIGNPTLSPQVGLVLAEAKVQPGRCLFLLTKGVSVNTAKGVSRQAIQ